MLRKLLLTGLGTLLILCTSVVVFGDTNYAPTGGENLLQTSMHRNNGRSEMVKGISIPADSNRSMVAAANKALGFASRGRDNMFIPNHGGGTGSGSGSGSGSGTGTGTGTKPKPGQVVPEPYALLLFGTGLAGLAATLRKRRQ